VWAILERIQRIKRKQAGAASELRSPCISDFLAQSLDRGLSQTAALGKYSLHRKQADASV